MATAKNKTKTTTPDMDQTIDAGLTAAETVVQQNTQAAKKGYETFVSMSRDAVDAACKAGAEVKGFENAATLPKANFEAMVEAGEAVIKGFETINGRMVDLAKSQIAEGVATQKALFGAKTFQEAMEIQQSFMRKSMDRAVQDSVELSSAWVRVANEATHPISQRVSATVSEFGKTA